MTKELKPCPFCGGEANIQEDNLFGTFIPYCPNCLTQKGRFSSRESAIKAWNRREPIKIEDGDILEIIPDGNTIILKKHFDSTLDEIQGLIGCIEDDKVRAAIWEAVDPVLAEFKRGAV